jgi:hypothetical protein
MPQYQFNDEGGGGYKLLPEGDHLLEVVNVTEKVSKSGNEMLVLDLECEQGKVQDYLVFSPKTGWKIDTFLKSVGKAPKSKGVMVDVTPALCLGAQGWARIEHEKDDEGKSWPRVAAWLEKKDAARQAQVNESDNIPF